MTGNVPPGGNTKSAGANGPGGDAASSSSAAGIPFYEKQRQQLKELISRKRTLEKKLSSIEDHISNKESEYLDGTPSGNIIIGFDNYVKGATAAAALRRKTGALDHNRVFSRSSVSYNTSADAQTAASTPAHTPLSSSFGGNGNGPSGAPTPTSAVSGGGGGGGGRSGASTKKSKKNTPAASAAAAAAAAAGGVGGGGVGRGDGGGGGEDSETDGREAKKVRTSFGARK
ncbi:histone acetyltransferase subunit NuA4-domain-containing protein [Chaetomium fimeti]|uniref:Chromatin modification-related protein EAF6 n=1 Tax=Chaetomium fimeti TaxID=1854472 RepID=A0AAE0HP22_9PEZI|nr:histone acetyltransferase subunit NuA4-domain-containing protein [Chaetomium fimeti]